MYYCDPETLRSDLMIFIGGLESRTSNRDLLQYFGSFGVVRFCEVQCWKNNPAKCRGFAIMDVADFTTYENILLTPHRLNGRQIEVKKLIHDKKELREQTNEIHERKIFVSSLPKKLTDIELSDYFSQFGPVELAYIIKHHRDGKSKGFGFVCFCDKTSKQKALALAQACSLQINGKNIVCSSYSSKMQSKEKKEHHSIAENSPEDMNSSNSGTVKEKMKSAGNKSQRSINQKEYAQIVSQDSDNLQLNNPIHSFSRSSDIKPKTPSFDPSEMSATSQKIILDNESSKFNLFLGAKVTSSSISKMTPIRLLGSAKEGSEL